MQDPYPPLSEKVGPGEAEILIRTPLNGACRLIVRGPEGVFFDWIMDNEERETTIKLMLLPNETIVKKRFWHSILDALRMKPLIIGRET